MKEEQSIKKVLFISQEITPYLPETEMSTIGRNLPQLMQEQGLETRTFMPKYGSINERRNQLHEVIRLSGMNLIIDDTDHPLIIKVASIQSARLQVYFIDNEDYFQRKHTVVDEDGNEFEDNDERTIFFVRGVLETVKKLRWTPDVIHCQGWLSALAPLYIKKSYKDDPFFKDSKVVYSLFDDKFEKPFPEKFAKQLLIEGIKDADLKSILGKEITYENLSHLAIDYSDGVIQASEKADKNLIDYTHQKGLKFLPYVDEEYAKEYLNFYKTL